MKLIILLITAMFALSGCKFEISVTDGDPNNQNKKCVSFDAECLPPKPIDPPAVLDVLLNVDTIHFSGPSPLSSGASMNRDYSTGVLDIESGNLKITSTDGAEKALCLNPNQRQLLDDLLARVEICEVQLPVPENSIMCPNIAVYNTFGAKSIQSGDQLEFLTSILPGIHNCGSRNLRGLCDEDQLQQIKAITDDLVNNPTKHACDDEDNPIEFVETLTDIHSIDFSGIVRFVAKPDSLIVAQSWMTAVLSIKSGQLNVSEEAVTTSYKIPQELKERLAEVVAEVDVCEAAGDQPAEAHGICPAVGTFDPDIFFKAQNLISDSSKPLSIATVDPYCYGPKRALCDGAQAKAIRAITHEIRRNYLKYPKTTLDGAGSNSVTH